MFPKGRPGTHDPIRKLSYHHRLISPETWSLLGEGWATIPKVNELRARGVGPPSINVEVFLLSETGLIGWLSSAREHSSRDQRGV